MIDLVECDLVRLNWRLFVALCSSFLSRCRNGSPILVTLVAFWHFSMVRHQVLTPAIAFTSVCAIHLT